MTYGSEAPSFHFPELTPAIKRLLLVNVGVFVINALLAGRLSEPTMGGGGAWLAFSWPKALEGYGLGALRLLSYQFVHSFQDPFHLIWNSLTLYFFGTMAEGSLGYRGTFRLYLVGGAAGALLYLGFALSLGYADVPLVGASGACYSFLVYAACMAPRMRVIVILFPVPLGLLAGILVFVGAYEQYVEVMRGSMGGVANSAHLGGAALGFLAFRRGWFRDYGSYGRIRAGFFAGWGRKWAAMRARKVQESAAASQHELDRILAKIQGSGLPSLTAGERKTLERASERARKK